MLNKVTDYIKSHKLIKNGDRIIIGVSGGADSVCLLHVLYRLYKDRDVSLFVVHVHHGMRDEAADRDEAFVKTLCNRIGVAYSAYHYDVITLARTEGLSEEEAGRKVRYQAFVDASKRNKCNKVAVAHNKNDNAETILFNLFRGSGINGLTGMDSILKMKTDVGSITIIRPLLFAKREDIEIYLEDMNIEYKDDLTNFGDAYSRNKIRNRVLSYVKDQINSNVIDNIANAAGHLDESYEFINKYIEKRYDSLVREGKGFCEYRILDFQQEDLVIQKGIIRKILGLLAGKLKDIEAKHVEDVLSLANKQVGKEIHLPYQMIALKKYHMVVVYLDGNNGEGSNSHQPIEPRDVIIPGRTYLEENGVVIEAKVLKKDKNKAFPKNSCMKWFDYDKIENTLILRTRKAGDYLQIDSQGGRKKLKDYFIDEKIPKEERDRLLLVADGEHILWVMAYGNRISEKYKISDNTKRILSMILINAKEKDNDR